MIMVGNDMGLYIAVMVLTLAIGGGAQWYVTTMLHKYQKIPCSFNITGAQIARKMSIDKGISNVDVLSGGPSQAATRSRLTPMLTTPPPSLQLQPPYTKWAMRPSMPRDTA